MVGLGRLELPISPVSWVRSNQLSYKRIVVYSLRIGGAKQDRTADLLRARQALSQLSYSPVLTTNGHVVLLHLTTKQSV